ncbi:MAG: 16S rRNA (guanine(966)-N(2))-methyltransferase RsmD [SAR202 cluster bacterium Io17-Chloro-G9]|nr:MAG: 16S rRNA (guanine(966)-N(2))-methyltransferase RsmD [SAR202 cluster bacterium Io17-Chloro-G9]
MRHPERRGRRANAAGPTTTRLTGGSARGRVIRSAGGRDLRPTSEKVRSAIFSILGTDLVAGAAVLDLYAGTGALGIEALSRAAESAVFVEASEVLCRSLRNSLEELGMTDQARVVRANAENILDHDGDIFSLVFLDPPYRIDPWDGLLGRMGSGESLADGAVIVAEHYYKRELAPEYGGLIRTTERRYGDTTISIFDFGGAIA